jgi:hypothetical protein
MTWNATHAIQTIKNAVMVQVLTEAYSGHLTATVAASKWLSILEVLHTTIRISYKYVNWI